MFLALVEEDGQISLLHSVDKQRLQERVLIIADAQEKVMQWVLGWAMKA